MKNENRVIQINNINIGSNIKELRENLCLKQTEVITKLQLLGVEISVYSFSKIENGRQNPSIDLLEALTTVFNCDYNKLFGR